MSTEILPIYICTRYLHHKMPPFQKGNYHLINGKVVISQGWEIIYPRNRRSRNFINIILASF